MSANIIANKTIVAPSGAEGGALGASRASGASRPSYPYQTADPLLYSRLAEFARHNRNNPTEAESLLWGYLKGKGIGATFKRQHVIGDYIADFVCLDTKLIVELDGGYHQLPQQQMSDSQRTEWLGSKGYRVLRFTNEDLFNNIEGALRLIEENLYV